MNNSLGVLDTSSILNSDSKPSFDLDGFESDDSESKTIIHPKPFWVEFQGRCHINVVDYLDFLKHFGFGELNADRNREFVKRRDDNIIELVDDRDATLFVYNYFQNEPEDSFEDLTKFGVINRTEEDEFGNKVHIFFSKEEVIRSIINVSWFKTKNMIYLNQFNVDKKKIKILLDFIHC